MVITRLEALLGAPVVFVELKHKPGRRRTLRAVGPRARAIVKLYATNRAPVVAARIAALSEGPSEPAVPRLLAVDADAGMVVLSEVAGAPLRVAVLNDDLISCRRIGRGLGGWHAAWRGASPAGLEPHSARRELELLRARIEQAPAGLATAATTALNRMPLPDWNSETVVHRDLYEEQVVLGAAVGLFDLDDAALGPPELDIGNLWAHLDLLALRAGRSLLATRQAILDGYASAGPPLDPVLLAQCRALTLLRLACIHRLPDLLKLANRASERRANAHVSAGSSAPTCRGSPSRRWRPGRRRDERPARGTVSS